MKTSTKIFRFVMSFASLYHFVLGLIGLFAGPALIQKAINVVYGISVNLDPQFLYLSKFISAYFIMFAIVAAFIAMNPIKYAKFTWAIVALFAIRIINRIVAFDLLEQAFQGATWAHNMQTILTIGTMSVILVVTMPRESK